MRSKSCTCRSRKIPPLPARNSAAEGVWSCAIMCIEYTVPTSPASARSCTAAMPGSNRRWKPICRGVPCSVAFGDDRRRYGPGSARSASRTGSGASGVRRVEQVARAHPSRWPPRKRRRRSGSSPTRRRARSESVGEAARAPVRLATSTSRPVDRPPDPPSGWTPCDRLRSRQCASAPIPVRCSAEPECATIEWNVPTEGRIVSDFLTRVASAPISWGICEVPGWGAMLPTRPSAPEMSGLGMPATELGAPGFLPTIQTRSRLNSRSTA